MDPRPNIKSNSFIIWQWNCRGFRKKRGNLQQHIINVGRDGAPDVITLQETNGIAKLAGYKYFTPTELNHAVGGDILLTTLVKRNIPVIQHTTGIQGADHVLLELITTTGKHKGSLFILNVYSSSRKSHRFSKILRKAATLAGSQTILLVHGDFNAPHTAWGYGGCTAKGTHLWIDAQQERLTLITDPSRPTRRGTSNTLDTTPDLTFIRNNHHPAVWNNTMIDLGSDHYILSIEVTTSLRKPKSYKEHKVVDWPEFRKTRDQDPEAAAEICNLDEWVDNLKADASKSTHTIPEEANLEQADSRLLHLWEAKASLRRRLQKNKGSRALRRKISQIQKEIDNHAAVVTAEQWFSMCTEMDGSMNAARTWNILRHLLDETKSKTFQQQELAKLLHQYEGDHAELLQALQARYIGEKVPIEDPPYTGAENPSIDAPFTEAETRQAMAQLRTRSAPGTDGVTNKMLRNLDDGSVTALTAYFNKCWTAGSLPSTWKTATTTIIPKPGKPLQLGNLRPISLTSCLGKLLEHMVLNRLHDYVEEHHLFPDSMFGFRRGLSTQDVLLQLEHDVIRRGERASRDTRAVLGLDLASAFDEVRHTTILEGLTDMGVGIRAYAYIKAFLSRRTTRLNIGDLKSEPIELGGAGTPQGSVLSPFLFNVAMRDLPQHLDQIPGLRHSLYADDITLWTTGGSDGDIQDSLQTAIEVVEKHVTPKGLQCSPQKSELLVIYPGNRTPPENQRIKLWSLSGTPIQTVDTIKILGLHVQTNGRNTTTIQNFDKYTIQVNRMISRVANRRQGLSERNLLRLTQAFAISKIVYVAPYLQFTRLEMNKINTIIRRSYKQALGIPTTASTHRLLELGVHNTVEELIEAHRTAQVV